MTCGSRPADEGRNGPDYGTNPGVDDGDTFERRVHARIQNQVQQRQRGRQLVHLTIGVNIMQNTMMFGVGLLGNADEEKRKMKIQGKKRKK